MIAVIVFCDVSQYSWLDGALEKALEFTNGLYYITNKESTHSKVDAPKQRLTYLSLKGAFPVDQTGGAFLFLLFSLIEKGKQRY